MTKERIVINLASIGHAFAIAWNAHQLLNALLDGGPQGRYVRELAIELNEFQGNMIGGGWMDDEDGDSYYRIGEALREDWSSVRIDWQDRNLILEREVEDDNAEPGYWPGDSPAAKSNTP